MVFDENKLLPDNRVGKFPDKFFFALVNIAVIATAFGFWPFENSKIWQMLNIPNLCCIIGMIVASLTFISNKGRRQMLSFMPHVSILAYLCINVLSIAFADSLSRPLNYTAKLILVFSGGFFIFQRALSSEKAVKIVYRFIITAVFISILGCIYTRLIYEQSQFGFIDNVFKYGTYIGILAVLCGIYLLSGSRAFLGLLLFCHVFFLLALSVLFWRFSQDLSPDFYL